MADKKDTQAADTDAETPGLQAAVTQNVPDFQVEVLANQFVSPGGEDKTFEEGQKFTVDGPTAMSLASAGHVKIVGMGP